MIFTFLHDLNFLIDLEKMIHDLLLLLHFITLLGPCKYQNNDVGSLWHLKVTERFVWFQREIPLDTGLLSFFPNLSRKQQHIILWTKKNQPKNLCSLYLGMVCGYWPPWVAPGIWGFQWRIPYSLLEHSEKMTGSGVTIWIQILDLPLGEEKSCWWRGPSPILCFPNWEDNNMASHLYTDTYWDP